MENKDGAMEKMQKMTARINEEDLEKVTGGAARPIKPNQRACSMYICRECKESGASVTVHAAGCTVPQNYRVGNLNCCCTCEYYDEYAGEGYCICL